MARAMWTGSLGFGLVNVPVGLYSATSDKTIRFHQFQDGTSDRIRLRRVNERTQEEVEYGDIVKGYDLGGGEYVMVTPEELEAAAPERSRLIGITDFVDLDEIDPVFYRKTYFLAPQGEAAERPYALLRQAMEQANKVAIGTMVMRSKEYLVAVRPDRDALVLETMFFADEVRDPLSEVDQLPVDVAFQKRELEMAQQLVETMSSPWEPARYRDTFRERVEQMIERKRQGEQVVTQAPAPQTTNVVDLMEALRRSVEQSRGRSPATPDAGASDDDLESQPKSTLAKQASDLDVAGRSKMTKDELVTAIREARRNGQRAS